MQKLFIKRHWISKWNEAWVIQWWLYDKWLSYLGVQETKELIESLIKWLPIKRIITSSLKRTKETGGLIADSLNLDLNTSDDLVEFASWILAWKKKTFIKENYPDYYDIWMKRGDLDWIPWAEKWNHLQARALLFLYDYIDNHEYSDLIISHAWFIRCLVNTIIDNTRETPVDIKHNTVHEFNNVWKNIKHEQLLWWFSNKITLVKTQNNKFIIRERKINNEPYYKSINYIISRLNELSNITNELYIHSLKWDTWIQVCEYIEWNNVYGELDKNKRESLFWLFNDLIHFLWKIEIDENIQLPTLEKKLSEYISRINDSWLIQEWEKILDSLENSTYSDNLRIVDYDLHRWNLVFKENQVRVIDMDSMLISEIEYQIACIVTSFIFEWCWEIDEIIGKIQADFSVEKVKFYIKIRAYIWMVFFQEIKEKKGSLDDKTSKIYDSYYKIFKSLS